MNNLLDKVKDMASDLGIDLKFDIQKSLVKYKKGAPLSFGELKNMKDGDIVWATYKEYGESGYRINGAFVIELQVDGWFLDDGSSFSADFEPMKDLKDEEQCFDSCCGQGEMYLWKAKLYRSIKCQDKCLRLVIMF